MKSKDILDAKTFEAEVIRPKMCRIHILIQPSKSIGDQNSKVTRYKYK